MRSNILKYSAIAIGCIILLFIITNPSFNQFKSFVGQGRDSKNIHNKRTSNWLIFSTYESSVYEEIEAENYITQQKYRLTNTKYFAIFLNFYESNYSTEFKEMYQRPNTSE